MNEDVEQIFMQGIGEKFFLYLYQDKIKRVFFSAPFGMGKTTFLQSFFAIREIKYEVFHLFPVNYEIASNENILNLLKADLLAELYEKDNTLFTSSEFIDLPALKVAGVKAVDLVLNNLGGIGRPYKVIKGLLDISIEAKKSKQEKSFFDTMKETDIISEFIARKVKKLKGENKNSVLILDDLDRIDPEHLFRILNNFSACFGNPKEIKNKFGFDKIILVADYDNLKSIFHHKYGAETDASGYLNKFCDEKYLYKIIDELPSRMFYRNYYYMVNSALMRKHGYESITPVIDFFGDILWSALACGKCNLRVALSYSFDISSLIINHHDDTIKFNIIQNFRNICNSKKDVRKILIHYAENCNQDFIELSTLDIVKNSFLEGIENSDDRPRIDEITGLNGLLKIVDMWDF